jgi:hypothetical protein
VSPLNAGALQAVRGTPRDETERGKTVYIASAWQNERGLVDNWPEILSVIFCDKSSFCSWWKKIDI